MHNVECIMIGYLAAKLDVVATLGSSPNSAFLILNSALTKGWYYEEDIF